MVGRLLQFNCDLQLTTLKIRPLWNIGIDLRAYTVRVETDDEGAPQEDCPIDNTFEV